MLRLPEAIDAAVTEALDLLGGRLRCTLEDAPGHKVAIVAGWSDDAETVEALAKYLVGLRVCAVKQSLAVRAALEDTAAERAGVVSSVEEIVGAEGVVLSDDQKQDERNPWIAEGIWHLLLFLASRQPGLHPPGRVVALHYPHVKAKDHGLDVTAIYDDGTTLGLSLIETKAYRLNPNKAISKAVAFFKDADAGAHDTRLRQAVDGMRAALPETDQSRVSPALWRAERSYVPNPHYDASVEMDWTNARPSFAELKFKVYVMPHPVAGFSKFFDDLADAMRTFAKSLDPHV